MRDYYYDGLVRLDWGLGNPNITAALIVSLLLASFVFAFLWRPLFWLSLPLATVFACSAMMTASRGGFIAMLVGVGFLILYHRRWWRRSEWIGLAVAAVLVAGVSHYQGYSGRYTEAISGSDTSVSNRWQIYQTVPQLIVASPHGWGVGETGRTYRKYFQDPDRSQIYSDLHSTHFTWMAERGWLFSAVYLAAWLLAFWLTWPLGRWRCLSVGFAVLLAYALSSSFSLVGNAPINWLVPGVATLLGLVSRLKYRSLAAWRQLVWLLPLVSVLAVIGLFAASLWQAHRSGIQLSSGRDWVQLGQAPSVGLFRPSQQILGDRFGSQLRIRGYDSLQFRSIDRAERYLDTLDTLILSGSGHPESDIASLLQLSPSLRLVWINPSPSDTSNITTLAGHFREPEVILGKSLRDIPIVEGVAVRRVAGAEFMAGWVAEVFDEKTEFVLPAMAVSEARLKQDSHIFIDTRNRLAKAFGEIESSYDMDYFTEQAPDLQQAFIFYGEATEPPSERVQSFAETISAAGGSVYWLSGGWSAWSSVDTSGSGG